VEPPIITQISSDVVANTSGHLLDNGTSAYYYDFKEHKLLAGATTELLSYRWVTLNAGAIRSVEDHTNVLVITGLDLHIGSYLAHFKSVDRTMTKMRMKQGLLQYFTLGVWGGQDFSKNEYRYGLYAGLRKEFK
jgi:hypothetical protein